MCGLFLEWGGDLDDYTVQTRPKLFIQEVLLVQFSLAKLPLVKIAQLFFSFLDYHKQKHEHYQRSGGD
jgi:hypothetical protein